MAPTPYTITVDEPELKRLKQKLELARFPDELDESAWEYGAPLADIKRLATYWKDGFDWHAQVENMNKLPNFRTSVSVDGFRDVDLHFLHSPSAIPGAIPLLFSHGWPGNFLEVTKMLPLLVGADDSPAFHVVAPSLPNYGFSAGVSKRGFGLKQYAETFHKLMLSLGYSKYVTQGGDWGFYITRMMGALYPKHCLASHINMIRASPPKFTTNPLLAIQHVLTPYSASEQAGMVRSKAFREEGAGYRLEQCTKPQTLNYSLADSPVGLLAWIYEKLVDWTDEYPWTDDEILTWISIYYFSTAGPGASTRIYYEATHGNPAFSRDRTEQWIGGVKLGLGYFPRDLTVVPSIWGRTLGEVVYERRHERGGHFAAWEQPEALAGDLKRMFGRGGPCEGIVPGKSGF